MSNIQRKKQFGALSIGAKVQQSRKEKREELINDPGAASGPVDEKHSPSQIPRVSEHEDVTTISNIQSRKRS